MAQAVSVSESGASHRRKAQEDSHLLTEPEDSVHSAPGGPNYLPNILHTLIVGNALSICVCFYDGSLFSYHPVFMTLGFLLFMAEGVMAAVKFRNMEPGGERVAAIQFHAYTQIAGLVCILGALYAIFTNKIRLGKEHFMTDHSKVGLAAIVLALATALGGVVSFRKLGLLQQLPDRVQPVVKLAHRKAGAASLLLATAAAILGLRYPHMSKGLLTYVWQFAIASIAGGVVVASGFLKGPVLVGGRLPEDRSGDDDPPGDLESSRPLI